MAVRLQALSEAMHAFAEATAEPQLLLGTIARRTAEALHAYCGFSLISEDGARLEHVAMFDMDPSVLTLIAGISAKTEITLDSPHPLAEALRTEQCLQRPGYSDEVLRARFPDDQERTAIMQLAIKSQLFVPLRARGKILGGFSLLRHGDTAAPFDEADVHLATSLADHAALSIANGQLLQRVRAELAERERLEAHLRVLTELAKEFSAATLDYQRLLDLFTRRMSELLGEMCTLRFVSADRQWIEQSGSLYHPDPEIVAIIRDAMLTGPVRMGEGFVGTVAATGVALVIPSIAPAEIAATVAPHNRALVERLGIRTLMSAPLWSGGHVIGVASMTRSQPDQPYTQADLRLFEEAARHVMLAIADARLFASSQRELVERERLTDRLRLISEIAQEFAAHTGHVRELVDLVAHRLGEVIGDTCSIRLLTDDGQHLEAPGSLYSTSPDSSASLFEILKIQPQRLGEGISGQVALTGVTTFVPRVVSPSSADDRFAAVTDRLAIKSLVIVALRSSDRVIGVCSLFRTETLLVIEDDEPLRTAISRMLAPRGYRVLVAISGADAIELAARHDGAIDLVLTDVIMPGLSGPEVVDRLRETVGPIRTLYMSGYADHPVLRSETFNASVHFIQKPFAPDQLASKVRAVLDAGH